MYYFFYFFILLFSVFLSALVVNKGTTILAPSQRLICTCGNSIWYTGTHGKWLLKGLCCCCCCWCCCCCCCCCCCSYERLLLTTSDAFFQQSPVHFQLEQCRSAVDRVEIRLGVQRVQWSFEIIVKLWEKSQCKNGINSWSFGGECRLLKTTRSVNVFSRTRIEDTAKQWTKEKLS